jgi:polyphosphate glucokinase
MMDRAAATRILAVDIGATTIKSGPVDSLGTLLGPVERTPTPFPCWPERLVATTAALIEASGCVEVGVGFPGEYRAGRVIEPGNLSRPAGISSPIDPAIHRRWVGFEFEAALRRATGVDVRVVNDASLAALGCCDGEGRELVLTLGTGLGIALVVAGELVAIRDVGAAEFVDGGTYDQLLGERSRSADERRWRSLLIRAVGEFVTEFDAQTVHFGGGNARLVDVAWFEGLARVVVKENDDTLRGAARLFAGGHGTLRA